MKIVVDCRMYSFSGIGRYIKDIVPSLCAEYDKVALIGNIAELQHYKDEYKSVELIEMNTPIYSIMEQLVLPKKIPSCDIFFTPHYNVPLFPIKAKKRVTTMHDAYHLAFYRDLSLSQKIYAKIFYNGALRLSDKVITISQFSKSEFIKYTSQKFADKIQVIYRFVGDVIRSRNDTVIERIQISKANYFLFVGNVKPNKNLKAALVGFKTLVANNPNNTKQLTFKIVGKKDGFITGDSEISAMIEKDTLFQEKVQFTGHVSDVELIGLYKNAIALVFPSYYEGFGLPPLEAMYFECPTICSNAASIPEICGDASLYFDPSNPVEIAIKMLEIYVSEDLRETLKTKGIKQVKKYSKELAIKEHLKLFNNFNLSRI